MTAPSRFPSMFAPGRASTRRHLAATLLTAATVLPLTGFAANTAMSASPPTMPGATRPAASPWQSANGFHYRQEADGHVGCASEDGIHCKPGPLSAFTRPIRPLVCGDAHRRAYGMTGYDTPGHWCTDIRAQLFRPAAVPPVRRPAWTLQEEGEVVGRRVGQIRMPLGVWTLADRPTWIVRFELPMSHHSWLDVAMTDAAPADRAFFLDPARRSTGVTLSAGSMTLMNDGAGLYGHPSLDDQRRGTLVIRIDGSGQPRFVQVAGWPEHPETFSELDPQGALQRKAGYWRITPWTGGTSAAALQLTGRFYDVTQDYWDNDAQRSVLPRIEEIRLLREGSAPTP